MNSMEILAQLFAKFPGIGKKTALRYVYFLLKEQKDFSQQLSTVLHGLHDAIHPCKDCRNLCEEELCSICSDLKRNRKQLCVVSAIQDIAAIEDCQSYFGLYHVLEGLISPLEGQGPEQLSLNLLKQRVNEQEFQEIILATPPTLEGEVTARYIIDLFQEKKLSFTRIAQGMPKGGDFEFTDKFTLSYALEARRNFT